MLRSWFPKNRFGSSAILSLAAVELTWLGKAVDDPKRTSNQICKLAIDR